MAFDDVSTPAVVFVCVNMVVALFGNLLVLLVYGCRWRSTNDTRIYVMTLAALDLVCALVSSPRDLITLHLESECLVYDSAMHVYCRLSVFFTHHLNVASALILVAIATSRFYKVTKKDADNSKYQEPEACHAFKAKVRRLIRSVSTVRGAKIASVAALCIALLQVSPALLIYGSGDTADPSAGNVSEAATNGTAEEGDRCYSSCHDDVHPEHKSLRKVFEISQFGLFVILTILLVGIYCAILQNLCCKQNKIADHSDSTRRDSSFVCPDQSMNSLALLRKHENDENSARPAVSAEDVAAESESTDPGSPSSVSTLILSCNISTAERTTLTQVGEESDPAQSGNAELRHLTSSPPLSCSSEERSEAVFSRQTSQAHSYTVSNRLSTTSFQLTKTGNTARMTTLVFFMVTFIYIVSYFPYFVIILYEYLAESGSEHPWRQWGPSGQAALNICRRSYLIANAANPLVYGLCNPYFREQLGKLLICRRDII